MDETTERSVREAESAASAAHRFDTLEEFWDKAKMVLLFIAAFVAFIAACFAVCIIIHCIGLDLLAQWLFHEEYFIFGYNSIYDLSSAFLGW